MADVIIDGALPRTDCERAETLLDYLAINADPSIVANFRGWLDAALSDNYTYWENDVLQAIAVSVDTYVDGNFIPGKIVVGAHCPGDVVVYWPGDEDFPKDDDEELGQLGPKPNTFAGDSGHSIRMTLRLDKEHGCC